MNLRVRDLIFLLSSEQISLILNFEKFLKEIGTSIFLFILTHLPFYYIWGMRWPFLRKLAHEVHC